MIFSPNRESSSSTPRRRGGQPGNRNARGNRGNRFGRGSAGNRGGGAPLGNLNARRTKVSSADLLLKEYHHIPEAVQWIESHRLEICTSIREVGIDRAGYLAHRGLTPEMIASSGQELRNGLYTEPHPEIEVDVNSDENRSEGESR